MECTLKKLRINNKLGLLAQKKKKVKLIEDIMKSLIINHENGDNKNVCY